MWRGKKSRINQEVVNTKCLPTGDIYLSVLNNYQTKNHL